MITVIDYGLGNLASVGNALKKLEIPYQISGDIEVINNAKAFILPGVGAAGEVMKNLKAKGIDTLLIDKIGNGIPVLGICLGMQLLLSFSEEGNVECLGLIKGKVKKLNTSLKIPQIGWNQVSLSDNFALMKGIKSSSYFYFANSYNCVPNDKSIIKGYTDYDGKICSVLIQGNITGLQFHPEKSGDAGLKVLKNFWEVAC